VERLSSEQVRGGGDKSADWVREAARGDHEKVTRLEHPRQFAKWRRPTGPPGMD
jgi:hypothetical protein